MEKSSIVVDFIHLKTKTKIANLDKMLTSSPEAVLLLLGLAVTETLAKKGIKQTSKKFIRISNYNVITPLKDLKSNMMNNFVSVRGTIVRVSTVKPTVTSMGFLCTTCNQVQSIHFQDGKFKMPTRCPNLSCKGKVLYPQRSHAQTTKTVDWQRIRLQEKLADDRMDSGRIPRTVECEVTNDLVDLVAPGDVVCLNGTVKVLSTEEGRRAKNANMFFLYIDVNSLVKASSGPIEENADGNETFTKDYVQFSRKDLYGIREVIEQGGTNCFKLLVNSLCPPIFGHELVKAGLLLALFGGRRRAGFGEKEVGIRSDPHVLVVGDPGLGKSQMLSCAVKAAPRGVYVCGNTATTSGLTVTVCKDSETGDTALEAGALVLADQGVCCIDEFDKMTEHQALLEAMEQQSISIAKAGMVCSLPARSSVLAAANPVGGHYNKSKTVSENLKLSGALLSRFDLVFILLDKPDEEMDRFLSDYIMKMHSGKKPERPVPLRWGSRKKSAVMEQSLADNLKIGSEEQFDPIPQPLLRKYIAYAKKYVQPRISKEAAEILQSFYLKLRGQYKSMDAIPITTRQLESLIRLTEARARAELREVATAQDALQVIEIMKYSLWETYQDEIGKIDFQRSQNGAGMSRKGDPKRFIAIMNRISDQTASNRFTFDQLLKIAQDYHFATSNFQDFIDTLNNQGYLLKKGNRVYQLSTM